MISRGEKRVFVFAASLSLFLALSLSASAQRAEYAKPEELPGEGLPHAMSVANLGEYARFANSSDIGGLKNFFAYALRLRAHLGRTPNYCLGFDGNVGGSNEGFAYAATAYLAGLGARFGDGNVVSVCGGAGLDKIGSAVPRAWQFPAELRLALALGPIRPILWAKPAWISGSEVRKKGSTTFSFVDEYEAGLLFRIGRQHHYWAEMNAGGGPALGIMYRELMGTHAIYAMLGFEFEGER